jgi:hypothetical protein
VLEKVYTSSPGDDAAVNTAVDPPKAMLMPMIILAVSIIVLGVINAVIVTNVLLPVVKSIF